MADSVEEFDFGDNVDLSTFQGILDMDEGEEDSENPFEFSKSIVFGFLDQAATTFEKMQEAQDRKDLQELSELGHFLKGSSATLGYTKVKDECEKIQNYGKKKDATGTYDEPDEAKCLRLIGQSLIVAKHSMMFLNFAGPHQRDMVSTRELFTEVGRSIKVLS